jgi:hypothetical protein
MREILVVLAAVFVPAWLVGPSAFAADKPPRDPAEELVEVMGADQRAADTMHSLADSQLRDGTTKLKQRECIRQVGREEFTDWFARLVDRNLKPEEMRDALAYFTSAVGKKHLEAIEQKANVTAEDWPERRAFLDTTPGYQLITRALLTDSSEAKRVVDRIIRSRFYECDRQ